MRITYTYPALVRGKPPRGQSIRSALCLLKGAVEIPEVAPSDNPRSFQFVDSLGSGAIARIGEHTFIRIGAASTRDDTHSLLSSYLTNRMAVSICLEAPSAAQRAKLWPHWLEEDAVGIVAIGGRIRFGKSSFPRLEEVLRPEDLAQSDALSDPNETDVDRYSSRAEKLCSQVVSHEGCLWAKMHDPIVTYSESSGFSVHDLSFYDLCRGRHSFMPRPFSADDRYEVRGSYFDHRLRVLPLFGREGDTVLSAIFGTESQTLWSAMDWHQDGRPAEFDELELERAAKASLVGLFALDRRWKSDMVDAMWGLHRATVQFGQTAVVAEGVDLAARQLIGKADEFGYGSLEELACLRAVLKAYADREIALNLSPMRPLPVSMRGALDR